MAIHTVIDGEVRWDWKLAPDESYLNRSQSFTKTPSPKASGVWRPFGQEMSKMMDCAYMSGLSTLKLRSRSADIIWTFDFRRKVATQMKRRRMTGFRKFSVTSGPPKMPEKGNRGFGNFKGGSSVGEIFLLRRTHVTHVTSREQKSRKDALGVVPQHSFAQKLSTIFGTQRTPIKINTGVRDLAPRAAVFLQGDLLLTVIRTSNLGGKSSTFSKGNGQSSHYVLVEVLPPKSSNEALTPRNWKSKNNSNRVLYETPSATSSRTNPVWNYTLRIPIKPWANSLKIKIVRKRSTEGRVILHLSDVLPFLNPLISGDRPLSEVQGLTFHHNRSQQQECSKNVFSANYELYKDLSGKFRSRSYGTLHLAFRFVPHRAATMWRWNDNNEDSDVVLTNLQRTNKRDTILKSNRRMSLNVTPPVYRIANSGRRRALPSTPRPLSRRRSGITWLGREHSEKIHSSQIFGTTLDRGVELAHSPIPDPCYDCVEYILDCNRIETPGIFR